MSVPRMSRSEPLRLMRALNLIGLDFLDPLVLAAPIAKLAELCERDEISATMCRSRMADWNAASAWALKLRKGHESDAQLANILLILVAVEQEEFNADEIVALERRRLPAVVRWPK